MEFSFKWRTKALIVFDPKNPTQKVDIEAKDLGEAWKIWFEKHLDKNEVMDLNEISITQYKEYK
jgi:hypothetical protein